MKGWRSQDRGGSNPLFRTNHINNLHGRSGGCRDFRLVTVGTLDGTPVDSGFTHGEPDDYDRRNRSRFCSEFHSPADAPARTACAPVGVPSCPTSMLRDRSGVRWQICPERREEPRPSVVLACGGEHVLSSYRCGCSGLAPRRRSLVS